MSVSERKYYQDKRHPGKDYQHRTRKFLVATRQQANCRRSGDDQLAGQSDLVGAGNVGTILHPPISLPDIGHGSEPGRYSGAGVVGERSGDRANAGRGVGFRWRTPSVRDHETACIRKRLEGWIVRCAVHLLHGNRQRTSSQFGYAALHTMRSDPAADSSRRGARGMPSVRTNHLRTCPQQPCRSGI